MRADFEIVEHTADVGFRAWGATPAELFANAARALIAIATDPASIRATAQLPVEITGHDFESLMVNWLEELLYLFDTGRFAACDFTIGEIAPERLRARIAGEPRDPARHRWKIIVKAITYHQIEVIERNGRWEAAIFVDI
jgi:SHS2 domain-containing protein